VPICRAISEGLADLKIGGTDWAASTSNVFKCLLSLAFVAGSLDALDGQVEEFFVVAETVKVGFCAIYVLGSLDYTICLIRVTTFAKKRYTAQSGRVTGCAMEPLRVARARTITKTAFIFAFV